MKNVQLQRSPPITPRQQINNQDSENEIVEVSSNSGSNKSWWQSHSKSMEEDNAIPYGQCFALDHVAALGNIPANMYNEFNRAAEIFVNALHEGTGCCYDSSEHDSSDEDDLSIATQEREKVERIAREVLLKMSLSEDETLHGMRNEKSTVGKKGRSFSSSQKSTRKTVFFRKKNKDMIPSEVRISNITRKDRSKSKRRKESVRVAPAVSDSRNRNDKQNYQEQREELEHSR